MVGVKRPGPAVVMEFSLIFLADQKSGKSLCPIPVGDGDEVILPCGTGVFTGSKM